MLLIRNITVTNGVTIVGASRTSVKIGSDIATNDIILMGTDTYLYNLSVAVPDNNTAIVGRNGGVSGVYNVNIIGNGVSSNGIGIHADSGSGRFVGSGVRFDTAGIGTCILNSSGICTLEDLHIPPQAQGTIGVGIHSTTSASGAAKTNLSDMHIGNPNIVRMFQIDGGIKNVEPRLACYTPNITGVQTVIYSDGEFQNVTIYGGNFTNIQNFAVEVFSGATGENAVYRISANHEPNYFYPPLVAENADFSLNFTQEATDRTRSSFNVFGSAQFNVGFVERPTVAHIGHGSPYTTGMVVLTTDNTATSTTDGGNFLDVTEEAASTSNSSFGFQDTLVNNTILIGTQRQKSNGDNYLFYGLESICLRGDPNKDFVFEIWDGAAWVKINTLQTNNLLELDYGSSKFAWDNLESLFRFGVTESTTWVDKTINGVKAKWVRIRCIVGGIAPTRPLFENFKLVESAFNVGSKGNAYHTGLSMFKENINIVGNVWSSFGGGANLSNLDSLIGSGPTQYTHRIEDSRADSTSDAYYIQIPLPNGLFRGLPIQIGGFYELQGGVGNIGGTPCQFTITAHKMTCSGIPVADPLGLTSYNLVPRDISNTTTLLNLGVETNTVDLLPTGSLLGDTYASVEGRVHFTNLITITDIEDLYPEDIITLRIEFSNQDGGADVGLWGLTLQGINYQFGNQLNGGA